uniref:Alcohol oxidase n=1 Tax=Ganoderma boninense TaxID=34458 RepID=A0A5K1JSJ6_9APHY|nr:Alcohol oxidase [Ganoderma boninense]
MASQSEGEAPLKWKLATPATAMIQEAVAAETAGTAVGSRPVVTAVTAAAAAEATAGTAVVSKLAGMEATRVVVVVATAGTVAPSKRAATATREVAVEEIVGSAATYAWHTQRQMSLIT